MGGAEEQGGRYAALFVMSFLRHEEIYRSDVGLGHTESRSCGLPPALIGLDEFPVGYSLAGCSPADPASASPTGEHCAVNSSRQSRIFHRTANSVLTVCLISGGRSRPPQSLFSLSLLIFRFRAQQANQSRLDLGTFRNDKPKDVDSVFSLCLTQISP